MPSKARTLSNSLDSVLWDLQCSGKSLKYCVLWQAILEENIVSSRLWPSVTATEWLLTSSLHNKHHWPAWQTFPREFVEKVETKREINGEREGREGNTGIPSHKGVLSSDVTAAAEIRRVVKKQPQNAKNNNYKQTNKTNVHKYTGNIAQVSAFYLRFLHMWKWSNPLLIAYLLKGGLLCLNHFSVWITITFPGRKIMMSRLLYRNWRDFIKIP